MVFIFDAFIFGFAWGFKLAFMVGIGALVIKAVKM